MKYRLKSTEIEAMQLTKDNREAMVSFIGKEAIKTKSWDPVNLYIIKTNSEDWLVTPGQYVLKLSYGQFSVMNPDDFMRQYEPIVPPKEQGLKK